MSPAAEAQKSASAKSGKLGGKEFEETFKPRSKDSTARELNDNKTKNGKKKKAGSSKVLIIIMIIIVLLGGAGAALYFSGNLSKIMGSALNSIGLQIISPGPSGAAGVSGEPGTSSAPGASDAPVSSITPAQPSVSDSTGASPSASSGPTDTAGQTFEQLRAGFSDAKLAELKQVGSIYSKMDPTSASAIMTKIYDTKQIAIIIYYMQPAASAQLLAKLDPALAAEVTKLLTS